MTPTRYTHPNPITCPPDEVAAITRELVHLSDLAADLAARRVRLVAGSARWLPAPPAPVTRTPRASRLAALWASLTGCGRPPVLLTPGPAPRHPRRAARRS